MKLPLLLCLTLTCLIPQLARAYDRKGNGGVSVVCRDQAGAIKSAEILDLYEGTVIHKRTYGVDALGIEVKLQLAQLKLLGHQQFLKALLDELALVQANLVFISKGNVLEPTNDAFPVINRKGCKFEQLANYTPAGQILVSQEIYEELDTTHKAALYLHEAIYALRRKAGDEDSQKSRLMVAHLMASNGDLAVINSLAGALGGFAKLYLPEDGNDEESANCALKIIDEASGGKLVSFADRGKDRYCPTLDIWSLKKTSDPYRFSRGKKDDETEVSLEYVTSELVRLSIHESESYFSLTPMALEKATLFMESWSIQWTWYTFGSSSPKSPCKITLSGVESSKPCADITEADMKEARLCEKASKDSLKKNVDACRKRGFKSCVRDLSLDSSEYFQRNDSYSHAKGCESVAAVRGS